MTQRLSLNDVSRLKVERCGSHHFCTNVDAFVVEPSSFHLLCRGAHAHMTSVTARTISGEAFSPFLLFLGSQNMRVTFYHSQKAEGKVMIENFQCALPQNFSI